MITKLQFILIVVLISLALALISSQKASPDSELLFGLKRLQEKHFLSFKSDPEEKVEYMNNLLDERLIELEDVVKNKKYDYVLLSSLRYSTTLGQITDLIKTNNFTNMADNLKTKLEDHKNRLNNLYVLYPKNTNNVEYKYIEDDINYLKIYLDKLSEK